MYKLHYMKQHGSSDGAIDSSGSSADIAEFSKTSGSHSEADNFAAQRFLSMSDVRVGSWVSSSVGIVRTLISKFPIVGKHPQQIIWSRAPSLVSPRRTVGCRQFCVRVAIGFHISHRRYPVFFRLVFIRRAASNTRRSSASSSAANISDRCRW